MCCQAFFLTISEQVHSCVHFENHAFKPLTRMSAWHLKALSVPYCELCYSPLSSSPFHNNASFALLTLLKVDVWEGPGEVVLDFTVVADAFSMGEATSVDENRDNHWL